MAGGTYAHFAPGRSGAGGKNAEYVTREEAVLDGTDGVVTHNLPADVAEGVAGAGSYAEARDHLTAYARTQEAYEVRRHGGRAGEPRTHYRAVLSFERPVTTDQARGMAAEWLAERFPEARAFAVVHRNTDHVHVHAWIDARGTDGKKLHFSNADYRSLDESWNRVYSREMGRDEQEHLAKKAETREYRRARALGREAVRPERDPKRGPGWREDRPLVEVSRRGDRAAKPNRVERLRRKLERTEARSLALDERRAEGERAAVREAHAVRQMQAGLGGVYRDPSAALERLDADARERGEGPALQALARDPGRYGALRGAGVGRLGNAERRAAWASAQELRRGFAPSYFEARRDGGTAREGLARLEREQAQLRAKHARTVQELSRTGVPMISLGGRDREGIEAEAQQHAEFMAGVEREAVEESGRATGQREAEREPSQDHGWER